MAEQVEQMQQVEQKANKNLSTSSKYEGQGPPLTSSGPRSLCDLLAAELMIGFWFGIGVILAVKMVQSLEYCIDEIIRRKSGYCQ